MLNKDVSFFPTLFRLYSDELETNLNERDGDPLCLFSTVIAFLLYADNVILLYKSRSSLQRLLNKQYEVCTSSTLDVNLS